VDRDGVDFFPCVKVGVGIDVDSDAPSRKVRCRPGRSEVLWRARLAWIGSLPDGAQGTTSAGVCRVNLIDKSIAPGLADGHAGGVHIRRDADIDPLPEIGRAHV